MSARDYYEVLGVQKSSSPAEIKAQYRKMALKFHPDRNKSPEAVEHFKEISEAYAVLSDAEKRRLYDQNGHAGVDGQYSKEDIFRGAKGNFTDIFGDMFGQRGGFEGMFDSVFGGRQRGEDIMCHVSISLEDVVRGKQVDLKVKTDVPCATCMGSGCYPGTTTRSCGACRGRGQVRMQQSMGFSSFVSVQPCGKCGGQGRRVERPCRDCKGNGVRRSPRIISFELPPGMDAGTYTIRGRGGAMRGGSSGDLNVRVTVEPHPHFKRDGRDIFYDARISMIDAALGREMMVPTLEGDAKIKIRSGTQPNTLIKLRGKGVGQLGSRGRGDQFVRLVVEVPTRLSGGQKRLLREFEDA